MSSQSTHKNIVSVCLMTQPVSPPLQVGKDVLLGILPFYHIFGGSVGFPVPQAEVENANYRGCTVNCFSSYGRGAGRDYATVRT